jgi:uncharacterized protein with HEPN domain
VTLRVTDYLEHIACSAADACEFVAGIEKPAFLSDRKTQRADVMCLVIVGEAASKLMDQYPDFVAQYPQVPWRSMRGMRNRIAHGYFEIDLDLVWDTLKEALPALLHDVRALQRGLGP